MYISKALKRQKKFKKMFFTTMGILSLVLPIITYLANIKSMFVWSYLVVLEILILLAVIIKVNYYRLEYSYLNNRLRFKSGIFSKESVIMCNKVSVVHTNKSREDMEIIIVTTVNFKNKMLKPITKGFMQKYPEASHEYLRLKKLNPESVYYFQIIKKGALSKYILLDIIYKSCVNAAYTNSAVESIKISREQNEIT